MTNIQSKTKSVKIITEDGDSYQFETVTSIEVCLDEDKTVITLLSPLDIESNFSRENND